jgi:S-adenosylmethionine hydrolase
MILHLRLSFTDFFIGKNCLKRMIITLLTDFGTRDYFVGAMKGAILSINEKAKIIDITHEISPQDVPEAAFTILNYYRTFPPKTVHVCVVDPGVGSDRRSILVETKDYFFAAPDNGILSFVLAEEKNYRVIEITNEKYFRRPVSQTFHGRDVFAPVAAYLSAGVAPNEFGREAADFVRFEAVAPEKKSDEETIGEIVYIDHFGNLITNLKPENLPAKFFLRINGKNIEKHQKYYAEAKQTGEIFSIIGSAGFLEIVAFQDSAKGILSVDTGTKFSLISCENSG